MTLNASYPPIQLLFSTSNTTQPLSPQNAKLHKASVSTMHASHSDVSRINKRQVAVVLLDVSPSPTILTYHRSTSPPEFRAKTTPRMIPLQPLYLTSRYGFLPHPSPSSANAPLHTLHHPSVQ